jgi:hypothetical protein
MRKPKLAGRALERGQGLLIPSVFARGVRDAPVDHLASTRERPRACHREIDGTRVEQRIRVAASGVPTG